MSGHGYGESLSEFSTAEPNSFVSRREEILADREVVLEKKRKFEVKKEKTKEEKNFVAIGTYAFLELHFHKMLYAKTFTEQAKKGLAESDSKTDSSIVENTLKNISNYMLREAEDKARSSKYQLELNLEDKPKFRGQFKCEIQKVETLITEICGDKLEWKTPAIEPKYGSDVEDS